MNGEVAICDGCDQYIEVSQLCDVCMSCLHCCDKKDGHL